MIQMKAGSQEQWVWTKGILVIRFPLSKLRSKGVSSNFKSPWTASSSKSTARDLSRLCEISGQSRMIRMNKFDNDVKW